MSAPAISLRYKPPGPVGARYLASTKAVQAIMGPIGSGKTSLCLMKLVMLGQRQKCSSRDGIRKFKFCVVRDTYRQLWTTVIPSWFRWVPKDTGDWTGSEGGPASHTIRFQLADHTIVQLTAEFIAIGENRVEDVLRGYEVTAFYLNEADRLAREVFLYARGRAGRFPGMNEGGPSWYGILLDFNAPDTESWIYDDLFDNCPEEFGVFVQPSGFSPQAENLENLPPGYYENQAQGQPEWYVLRMLKNLFGYSRDGKPVYPEFNDLRHVSATIEPVRGLPLTLGADAGMSPAVIIAQQLPNGQWRWLDELVAEQGTGPTRFGADLARLLNTERYRGFKDIRGWADPSAAYGADKQAGERDWIEIVSQHSGVRFRPAPTNALTPRLESVRVPLTRTIDGTEPALLISTRCKIVRKGFNSGYRYKRMNIPGETRYTEDPEKNEYSHPHDAGQYVMVGGGEYHEVMGRKARAAARRPQTHAVDEMYGDAPATGGRAQRGGGRGQQNSAVD